MAGAGGGGVLIGHGVRGSPLRLWAPTQSPRSRRVSGPNRGPVSTEGGAAPIFFKSLK